MKGFPSTPTISRLLPYKHRPSVYGVRWDTVNDLYQPVQVVNGRIIARDYGSYPIQELMRRCMLTSSGIVQYYLHGENSLLKANGAAADLSGADGQVMVQVPQFSYCIFTEGSYKYFIVSLRPFSTQKPISGAGISSAVHPWYYEGGVPSPAAHKYVGAFEGVLYRGGVNVDGTGSQTGTAGDLIRSVYGYKPLTYFHRTERRTYSANGIIHQYAHWAAEAMILLYFAEYKSWNSQGLIPGYTEGGTWDMAKMCKTGITVGLGNASGSILWQNANASLRSSVDQTGKYVANSFRGIENFFGHVWKWTDGINVQYIGSPLTSARIYVCNNPSQFADDTVTNYTDTGLDFPLASGYQRNLHDDTLLCNSAAGASSTTFIRDYFYAPSAAGWRSLRSGGALTNGATAGVATRTASNSASDRTAGIGGRVSA